jgi:hypothetical protein
LLQIQRYANPSGAMAVSMFSVITLVITLPRSISNCCRTCWEETIAVSPMLHEK